MDESQSSQMCHDPQQMRGRQIDPDIDSYATSQAPPVPSITVQPPSPTRNCKISSDTTPAVTGTSEKTLTRISGTDRFLELVNRVRSWDRVTGTSGQRREEAGLLKVPDIQYRRSRRRVNPRRRRILKMPLESYGDNIVISEHSTEQSDTPKNQKLSSPVAMPLGLARNIQSDPVIELAPHLSDFMGSDIPKARSSQGTSRITNAIAKSPEGTHYASPYLRSLPPMSEPKRTPPVFTFHVHKKSQLHSPFIRRRITPTLTNELTKE